jgi:hypothetical protein
MPVSLSQSSAVEFRPCPSLMPTVAARLQHLDTLRGFLLALMAVNHIPSALHAFTDHPLGFVSAAEGFVFMAGLMAGYVYTRKWARGNWPTLLRSCRERALAIYRWHIGAYLGVFAAFLLAAFVFGQPAANMPPAFQNQPLVALLAGLLLVQQPPLFDVLPLYCVLLVATPWFLQLCARGRARWLLAGSVALWGATNLFCPQRPFDNGFIATGALNLCAWQLLYVFGLFFGQRWAARKLSTDCARSAFASVAATRRRFLQTPGSFLLLACAAGFVAVCFAARHALLPLGVFDAWANTLANKNNFAPLRLLNTAALFFLFYAVVSRWPRAFAWKPFAALGRSSLAVFSAHIPVAYALNAQPAFFAETAAGRWLGPALMLGALFAAAAWRESFPAQKTAAPLASRQPTEDLVSVPHESRTAVPADFISRGVR